MEGRYPVRIRIVTRAEDEVLELAASGMVYHKRSGWYLQYEETDDSGNRSRTIIKCSQADHEATVKRSGAVESQMRFVQGAPQHGYYRIGGMELRVTTILHDLRVELNEGIGTIYWEYDLFMDDMPARRYQLTYELS